MHEAQKYYRQALHFDQEINDPGGWPAITGTWRIHLARSVTWPGHLRCNNNPLAAFNAIGSRRGTASVLDNLGDLLPRWAILRKLKGTSRKRWPCIGRPATASANRYPIAGLGDVLLAQGDLAGARKQYEQALALSKEMNDEDFYGAA